MDSSKQADLLVSEEEIERLRRQRVSLKKSADLLGVSYNTVRKLAESGRLNTLSVGGQRKVTLYEIRRFLTQGNAVKE
jgi:excisionase family DNA binding protein